MNRLRYVLALLLWRLARKAWPPDVQGRAEKSPGQLLVGARASAAGGGWVVLYADVGGAALTPAKARSIADELHRAARMVEVRR